MSSVEEHLLRRYGKFFAKGMRRDSWHLVKTFTGKSWSSGSCFSLEWPEFFALYFFGDSISTFKCWKRDATFALFLLSTSNRVGLRTTTGEQKLPSPSLPYSKQFCVILSSTNRLLGIWVSSDISTVVIVTQAFATVCFFFFCGR